MSKDVRKALMIAKGPVSSGYLPPGHPEREANLARHMEGSAAPATLYHGTPVGEGIGDIHSFDRTHAIKRFNRPEGLDAVGTWLDESPGKTGAGMYAGSEGAIYPVHASLKNPWKPKSFDEFLDLMHTTAGRDPKTQRPTGRGTVGPLRDYLMSKGHDSIMFPPGAVDHPDQGPVWVSLHPESQLKSAVGNAGQFDQSEPEITKAEGGAVASSVPQGLTAPGMWQQTTSAMVPWYNSTTGASYVAPSGGYAASPGSGWEQVNYDDPRFKHPPVSQQRQSINPLSQQNEARPLQLTSPPPPLPMFGAMPSPPPPVMQNQAVGTTPTSPVYGATPPQPVPPAPAPVLGAVPPPVAPAQAIPAMVAPSSQTPPVLGATTPAPVMGTTQPVQGPTDNSFGVTRTNTKAEGGEVAAPVGGFPGMKAMPKLSAPQNTQATQTMMAAIPRMQESGPVSGTGYAPYTPTALPQRLAAVGVQPKVVPMSAEVTALKKQFPTATMDQLSEYNRAIADGGDPNATRSLMQAYGPTSNIKELQPWSPEFKGFDYARSRPVDDFGNPVGWTAPAKAAPTTGADGVPSGWDPRDWENMKNTDLGSPSDEYILNNPWTRGMDTLGGNVMPGEIGTRAAERSSQGPGIAQANALYQKGKKAAADAAISKIESMYSPENIGALAPVDANQARMDAVTQAAQTQGMGAARNLGGDSLPGKQSSYFSAPTNYTLNNALHAAKNLLSLTPLGIPLSIVDAIGTGTNAYPQAPPTGNRALDNLSQQGRMTNLGADAVNWAWRQFGGEAMQRATGGRAQACKEARKAIMIARAMGGRVGKADGGGIDEEAPVPAPVTSGPKTVFAYGGKQYEFAVTPPDKQITSKDLAAQTTDALQQHLSLPYMQQVANSKAAANKLAPYVGREKNGAVKPFLTMNAKLEKASAGYEAGPRYDAQAPLQLEGGVGVETIGMPLAPAYEHNKFKVCPNSAICKDECLGVTSGNYAQEDWWPRQNSKNRTQAFLSEPGALAVQLHGEIQNAKQAAAMRGNRLAVRLNVLSDIDPRVHESLIKANPDVDFYDYTKMNYDPIAPNHHYTYSSTGLSQPGGGNSSVNGLTEGVENKHQNWKQMRQRLDTGSNVAMVFSHKEHLPREVYDRETDKTYRVVDGTTHDYRPLDKQPEGSDGVIIGLQNLNKTGKQDQAYKDSSGFVVHYDPQVQMVPNKKTGLPTKTPVKGPSPGLKKDGKSLPRPTYPTNYRVEIAPQGGEGRADGGAVHHGQQKIHPDYAAQQFHNFHMFNGPESAPLAKGERPAQYAYGGPVEGDRELDQSGFYNAAAEAAQGIPQAKGTPQQMMSMVQKVPGTQETMKWSGADQAFAGQPIVSKDDLVKHFQTNAPKLEETQLGGKGGITEDKEKISSWLEKRASERAAQSGDIEDVKEFKTANSEIRNWHLKETQKDFDEQKATDPDFIGQFHTRGSGEPTKYHKYTIPGGENYREVLLHLPPTENRLEQHKVIRPDGNVESTYDNPESAAARANEIGGTVRRDDTLTLQGGYRSSHWKDHPNVVAHLRMSDRTLPQTNEKALHLEESQSDWGQAGRAGFKKSPEELASMKADMLAAHKNYLDLNNQGSGATEDQIQAAENKYQAVMNEWGTASRATTPEGPYVGNTAKWTELGLKRALVEAARGGHDKLIWTPGEDQADRYDLSRQVKQILVENHGGKFHVKAYDHDDSKVINEHVDTPEEMARLIGKEAADRAMEHMESSRNAGSHIPRADLRGVDLKVGGEGMKGYYDKIVPNALAKIVKSIGHTPEFGTDYIKVKPYEADLDVYKHAVTGKYHVATGDKRDDPDSEDMEAGPFNTHGEAVAHRDLLYKGLKAVPSLKITPAMRETISKGLPRKTGGFVPPARSPAVEQALKLTSKSGATLPAAVFLARQHKRRD